MESLGSGQKTIIKDSLALSQANILVRYPREILIDYDPSSLNSWQTLQTKDEPGDGYFQSDKVEECVDKNCGNPLNSRSAKAYQSANSRLDNIITKSESGIFNNPLEPLIDPKQLDPSALKADRNRNNKMPIESSSTGERGKLQEQKQDVRSRLATREIKEKNNSSSSHQYISASSDLSSSITKPPAFHASYQKSEITTEKVPKEFDMTPKQAKFYGKYDSTEGITTAFVLGGFFVFVCLLVVYKTKLKPMWKERHAKRHDTTPATRSEMNSSFSHLHKDFECIPLQTIHNEDCEELNEDDIYYADEFGNYVFPIMSPQPGSCSCPHSGTRRPSQISALSTAYTVKSLPGAMLYIPVESDYNTPVSLKRSLSDPEIYFPSAVRHSLIVAVNGIMPHEKMSIPSASASRINGEKGQHSILPSDSQARTGRSERFHTTIPPIQTSETTLQIDINVIQPTPTISPSHSLRSISGDSKDLETPALGDNFAGIPFLIVPPSPVRVRRVSFSDNSIDNEESTDDAISISENNQNNPDISISVAPDGDAENVTSKRRSRCVRQASLQAPTPDSPTTRRRRTMATRQMTLPCNFSGSMSYLQVPGQENRSGNSARLSPSIERRMRLPSGGIDEVEQSETANSPIIMRRRLGPQSSIESYYSFASEGDGDIFASMENLGLRKGKVQRQTSFCIPDSHISEYSEFNEDFNSSISELFCHRQRGRLENQGTFSEQGSIRSLSIDQEEITFELPGMRSEEINPVEPENEPPVGSSNFLNIPAICEFGGSQDYAPDLQFEDFDGYVSSSCSISMSSDMESSHQITVPVFIEPTPPEIRFGGGPLLPAEIFSDFWRDDIPRLVHQETMHTDSGLDTEEICPATPTGGRFSADALSPVSPFNKRSGPEDENLRMVLVRDIGIQCCAESPKLNSHRRSQSGENAERLEHPERPNSLSGKFPSELLF
eukprot:TRINITY_DN67371_c0_g1_i1.p1 TRINITY_DN67371_c0_g1~~TRINITY_DN67371_c0_g1_i1.p1  ORF type:complete len:950 (+),score=100.15 TRINITY_DN67371_c0_g1_i1:2-2851(+)